MGLLKQRKRERFEIEREKQRNLEERSAKIEGNMGLCWCWWTKMLRVACLK